MYVIMLHNQLQKQIIINDLENFKNSYQNDNYNNILSEDIAYDILEKYNKLLYKHYYE